LSSASCRDQTTQIKPKMPSSVQPVASSNTQLFVDPLLRDLVASTIAKQDSPPLSVDDFFGSFASFCEKNMDRNGELLQERYRMQEEIDAYNKLHMNDGNDYVENESFLKQIGYLSDPPPSFSVTTPNVDAELLTCAPQLVVPVDSARFALNAANARWGDLFDALYGTNAIDGERSKSSDIDLERAGRTFDFVNAVFDDIIPFRSGEKWGDLEELPTDVLSHPNLVGYSSGSGSGSYDSLLFVHNGLHLIIVIDGSSEIGKLHPLNISSVLLEAALTTILDCEDSVAAVDAEDKCRVYQNLIGLFRRDLTCQVRGKERILADEKVFVDAKDGTQIELPGCSLLLVRNVGMAMYTDVVTFQGKPVPEAFLDLFMTTLAGSHDLANSHPTNSNSRKKSIYIVKPKLHGSEEAKFNVDLYAQVEEIFKLPPLTLKIGIMDEERRTSANLSRCIYEARERVFFINTGFLDRTGSEIRASFHSGIMQPKKQLETAVWRMEYERQNVDIGILSGLNRCGQIGKGMWAIPDDMKTLLDTKQNDLLAGGSTAWVPSPTGATIHALHYHLLNVKCVQARLFARRRRDEVASLRRLLTPPLIDREKLTTEVVAHELKSAVQAILGYVGRWVCKGIGCSKVPDLAGVGKMEDRATLRISAQLLSNWLFHGVITHGDLEAEMKRIAVLVAEQNGGEIDLSPDSYAFKAGQELAMGGEADEYTETILHKYRRLVKQA